MMVRNILILITLTVVASQSFAGGANGMIRVRSINSVSTTINKLEAVLKDKGMTIFTRVSHSDGAAKVGLELRDTELLVFGNPKMGTLLMQCQQSAGLDLPIKALAYKDETGQVWLTYNDPQYIADRHHISDCSEVISKMTKALANFTAAATQ